MMIVSLLFSVLQALSAQFSPIDGALSPLLQDLSFGVADSPLLLSTALALLFVTSSYGLTLLVSLSLDGLIAVISRLIRLIKLDAGFPAQEMDSDGILRHPRSTFVSLALLALAVSLVIPIQFVFLVIFLLQLLATVRSSITVNASEGRQGSRLNQQKLLVNLYFWLLPMNAPVLLIWTRNLSRGWYGAMGGSDHNFLSIAGFLAIALLSSSGKVMQRSQSRCVLGAF